MHICEKNLKIIYLKAWGKSNYIGEKGGLWAWCLPLSSVFCIVMYYMLDLLPQYNKSHSPTHSLTLTNSM